MPHWRYRVFKKKGNKVLNKGSYRPQVPDI